MDAQRKNTPGTFLWENEARGFSAPQSLLASVNPNNNNKEASSAKEAREMYPIQHAFQGRWTRPDPRDEDFMLRKQIINPVTGASQYGVVHADGSEIIEYFKDKKAQEEQKTLWAMGSYLIDPARPETQERAFSIFPELRTYPDAYHWENVQMQEALRTMLRDGQINGQEDHILVMNLIRDDTRLPLFPAWDPDGVLIKKSEDDFFENYSKFVARGLFNPAQHAVGAHDRKEGIALQRRLKRMILRRLYPGLRKKSDEELNALMQKLSAVVSNKQGKAQPMDQNAIKLTNDMAEASDAFGQGDTRYQWRNPFIHRGMLEDIYNDKKKE